MRLNKKSVLITGAGSGQGRAAAQIFAAEGASVAVFDRDKAGAQGTVDAIESAGGAALMIVGDVAISSDVENAVALTRETFSGLDVLYNNAAIWSAGKIDNFVTELDEEGWDAVLSINLKGVFLFCKFGIPAIVASGGGSVINIASVAGLVGSRNPSHAYSASKGGLIALTRAMAIAYARQNVRVNVICPGGVDTPMLQPMIGTNERYERVAKSHPLGRLGTPEDVAHCALFLATDEAAWITGTTIPVDGGVSAA
jgi:NAD(P)-dependent dehydrogenase (short-subunit alcohol dehydrogenase family)